MQLPAQATVEHAAALAAALPELMAAGSGPVRIDAAALQDYDTATLALLLQAQRLARAAGRGFEVVGAPVQLVQLAQLYGIEELLSLVSGTAETVPPLPEAPPLPTAPEAPSAPIATHPGSPA